MKKIILSGSQNIKKYKISEDYSVMFYTVGRYAVFRYYEDDGLEVCEMDRSCMIEWLSGEEKKKLFNFEDEKKAEFKTYIVWDIPENSEEKSDENKKMLKEYNARGKKLYKNIINRENTKKN